MICSVDTETKGLNARKFIMGCSMTEFNRSPKMFNYRQEMWKYIKELGKREEKREKNVFIYGHNHEYDFYGYADLNDNSIEYYSLSPFIAKYNNIYFLDSFAIYRMSLKDVGSIIGLSKLETPQDLKDGKEDINKEEVKRYLIRDTEIVLEAILRIKEKLNEEHMKPRKLMTIGQISMNYFMNKIRKKKMDHILRKEWKKNEDGSYYPSWGIHKPKNIKILEKAYRGGRVEAFQVGKFKDTAMLDFNSLYPYSASKIEVPDLRKEIIIRDPLKRYDLDFILSNIGVSKCLLKKKRNSLGLIGVRYKEEQVFPYKKCYIIGTFTHIELKEAIKEEYEIIDIEVSVIYKKGISPFEEMMEEMYNLRLGGEFDSFFYKNMMNQFIGKLAQKKSSFKLTIDDANKRDDYISKGYKIKDATGTNYVYEYKEEKKPSKWYAVIIPSYINAYARIELYKLMKKIDYEDLLYSDTDSILFKNTEKYKKLIENTGEWLGEIKCIGKGKSALVYTKKAYSFGDNIKMSGVSKIFRNMEDFKKGKIKYKRMQSIKEGTKNAGIFKNDETDLKESMEKKIEKDIEINSTSLFIDEYEDNINKFAKYISRNDSFINSNNNNIV